MRPYILTSLALAASVAVGAPASAQVVTMPETEFGRFHALVIGNNEYQHLPKLTTAVNDAEAVTKLLQEKYGFEVTRLVNATRRQITGAFNDLRKSLTEQDNLLVYYAGHGNLDNETERGYWLPVDASPDDDSEWISISRLTDYVKAMSANHVLVVADSCYSGTLVRATPGGIRSGAERDAWLQRMNNKRSRTALASGGLEPVLDGGGGDHSVFAKEFLNALRENSQILGGEEVFDRLKGRVVVNADQTPVYANIRLANDEGGDFLFVPLDLAEAAAVEPNPQTPSPSAADSGSMELEFWRSIKNSTRPEVFEAYVKKFPNGVFVELAHVQARALRREQQTAPERTQPAAAVATPPPIEVEPDNRFLFALRTTNVREQPNAESGKVGRLDKGSEVNVTGKVKGSNWYRVQLDGRTAYVFASLLGDAPAAKPKPAYEPAKAEPATEKKAEPAEPEIYIAVRRAYVYKGPSTKTARSGEFFVEAESFKVTDLVEGGRWLKVITREGKEGFLKAKYAYPKGGKKPRRTSRPTE